MVGRSDLLKVKEHAENPMAAKMNLSEILTNPYANAKEPVTFRPEAVYDFQLEKTLDEKVLLKKLGDAVAKGEKASLSLKVSNTDRTFGTILGAEITRQHPQGLPEDTITVECQAPEDRASEHLFRRD